jgi:hypothetical protein
MSRDDTFVQAGVQHNSFAPKHRAASHRIARDPVSPRNYLSLCDFSFFPQLLISKLHFTANRKPPFRHTSLATPHDLNLIAPSLAQHPHPDLSKKN